MEQDDHVDLVKQSPDDAPACLICKLTNTQARKKFDDVRLSCLKKAAEMRLALSSDCFKDTTLEVNLMVDSGNTTYHSKSYKNYTAVKKKQSSLLLEIHLRNRKLGAGVHYHLPIQKVY